MLQRPRQAMPPDVETALQAAGRRAAYDARPDYQRNDYLMWIAKAARADTRTRRIAQMLDELARGDVYMNMAWKPR